MASMGQKMTVEELEQVKQYVLRELPRALAEDTEFALLIEGMLSEKFPRRDEFARLLDEVQSMRKDTNQRFDRVDQRFEMVDQRFESIDQRFESIDQRFDRVDQQFSEIRREIEGLKDWMHLNVGGFQTRAGKRLEDVVAGAFCFGLKRSDFKPEHVRLRQKLTDTDGVVFRAGKTREVDIIAHGSGVIVFEVKSTADADDIEDLADKVALVRHLNPGQKVEGVLVMLGADREHRELCEKYGLTLIP